MLYIFKIDLKVFADGYAPKEVDFVVVEQHPTQLNITLQQSKVTPIGQKLANRRL